MLKFCCACGLLQPAKSAKLSTTQTMPLRLHLFRLRRFTGHISATITARPTVLGISSCIMSYTMHGYAQQCSTSNIPSCEASMASSARRRYADMRLPGRMQHGVYMPTCTHTHTQTYIHPYIHTSIHPCIHASIHTYIHTYRQTDRQTDRHTYIHPYIHTSIHPCIHASMHPCIHASMHPCIRYNTIQYNTIQYNTIQRKTRQDKTRQDKTRQDKTRQDNACIHTYVHTYIHTYIHTYTRTCIHMFAKCVHNKI